jgi:hypothetical protein
LVGLEFELRASQVLYHLSHTSSLLCSGYFGEANVSFLSKDTCFCLCSSPLSQWFSQHVDFVVVIEKYLLTLRIESGFFFFFFSFFEVLGFELRVSHLLSIHSTTWVTLPALLLLVIFKVESHELFVRAVLDSWSSWSLLPE